MALQEFSADWVGAAPFIQHNGQLTNPRNPIVQAIAKITSLKAKEKKLPENIERVMHLEWCGGIYQNKPFTLKGFRVTFAPDARVIIPGEVVWSVIHAGAKKSRKGMDFQAGFIVDESPILQYDGPQDINELYEDDRFMLYRRVGVQKSSVMRARPVFPTWSARVTGQIDTDLISEEDLHTAMVDAGKRCGVGNWNPKHGRFWVENFSCGKTQKK